MTKHNEALWLNIIKAIILDHLVLRCVISAVRHIDKALLFTLLTGKNGYQTRWIFPTIIAFMTYMIAVIETVNTES